MYGRNCRRRPRLYFHHQTRAFYFFDWDIYKHVSPFQVYLVIVRVRHNETWPLYKKADQYFYHHYYSVRLIVCSFLQVEEPRRVASVS